MESVYITAIIVGGVLGVVLMIGGGILLQDFRRENGVSGLASAKNKAKADVINNDTKLKIAARNHTQEPQ